MKQIYERYMITLTTISAMFIIGVIVGVSWLISLLIKDYKSIVNLYKENLVFSNSILFLLILFALLVADYIRYSVKNKRQRETLFRVSMYPERDNDEIKIETYRKYGDAYLEYVLKKYQRETYSILLEILIDNGEIKKVNS